jgi:GNAT superfamily N-acetyltransferase
MYWMRSSARLLRLDYGEIIDGFFAKVFSADTKSQQRRLQCRRRPGMGARPTILMSSMNMGLVIGEAAASDVEEIISFHNAAYGDDRKPEHWIWEYKGNYPDSFVFTIIKDGEQVIATQAMIPIHIYVRGKRFLSGKSENTLLHPKYRGRGLIQDLYEFAVSLCKAKGMQFIWGYTPSIAAIKALGKIRFLTYNHVMYDSISALDLRCALSGVREENIGGVKKVVKSLKLLLLWLYSSMRRATCWPSDKGFLVRERLADQQDLDNFYDRLRKRCPDLIHINLDEKYLRWRIYNHPIFKYRTYFVYGDDLLVAYAFVNTHDRCMAHLTDFTFESVKAGRFLLQRILSEMRTEGIGAVTFFGNSRNPTIKRTFRLLQRFGFLKRKTSMHFVLRNLSFGDEESLFDVTSWYMNGLWTEGYRM